MSGFQPPHTPGRSDGSAAPEDRPTYQGPQHPGPGWSQPPGQPYPTPDQVPSPDPFRPQAGPVPLDQPLYGAGFLDAVKRFWRKYATFTGRSSRSEFWWWQLANLVVAFVLGAITSVISAATALSGGDPLTNLTRLTSGTGLVASIPSHLWALAVLVPTAALTIRRLHDTDRSGWWYLLAVPGLLSGWVTLLVPVSTLLPTYAGPGALPSVPPGLWALLLSGLVAGAGSIVVLVLCVLAPKPRGARFDRR